MKSTTSLRFEITMPSVVEQGLTQAMTRTIDMEIWRDVTDYIILLGTSRSIVNCQCDRLALIQHCRGGVAGTS